MELSNQKQVKDYVIINKEIVKHFERLDKVLNLCKIRLSRHYNEGEWDKLAKELCAGNISTPLFSIYLEYLLKDEYIKEIPALHGKGIEYIATLKGLAFKSFVRKYQYDINMEPIYLLVRIILFIFAVGAGFDGAYHLYHLIR